jgi:GTP-binding protein
MASPSLIEARKFFTQECVFIAGAADEGALPKAHWPEIAFWGRSNVGKSSLINALVNRRGLARTSSTPGRTQQINFFRLAERMMIVDLPGYGYAAASKEKVRAWGELTQHYIQNRRTLRRIILLVDSRHGLMTHDHAVMKFLDQSASSYQIVLTKSDQISAQDQEKKIGQIEASLGKHPAAVPGVLLTSASKGTGLEELQTNILSLIK